ncbi:hypothetical protein U8V72_11675 [Priestia filamentosa]|uniref:hypothetical protein n=1 Tax=Priestia filamentosa TaxID=1402861 RepID=UPI0005890434
MTAINTTHNIYTYDDVLKHYVEEKFQLVHYELILDSLHMAKVKDSEWKEKQLTAERLYKETEELVEFLYSLLEKERDNLRSRPT